MPLVRPTAPGFSLLELLCALGVLSLLLGAALPTLSTTLPALALDHAGRALVAELELARVRAIHRNTRVRAVVELALARYRIESESEGRFESDGADRTLPAGVTFDAGASTRVAGGRVVITFLPRGHTADNATIALGNGVATTPRRVVVSSAGRVRIQ